MAIGVTRLSASQLVVLTDGLADLIPFAKEALRIVRESEIPVDNIDWEATPRTMWRSILEAADQHDKVVPLVTRAVEPFPKERYLIDAALGTQQPARGPDVDWVGVSHDEVVVGDSDLLPSWFLDLGALRARAVARIVRPGHITGTGFVIDGDVFVTNNHVLPTPEIAKAANVQFRYEQTPENAALETAPVQLRPDLGFATSKDDDWTGVRILGVEEWGFIPPPPKDQPAVGDRVSIIQHPSGDYKQVALHENRLAFVSKDRLQYFTDTKPGSSGSPVFDLKWQWVGLHSSGGRFREPGTNRPTFRNQGIAAQIVYAGIEDARAKKKL